MRTGSCLHSRPFGSLIRLSPRLSLCLFFFLPGFFCTVHAQAGFSNWQRTEMWDLESRFRGVHWVEGHGWFATGSAEIEMLDYWGDPVVYAMGSVARSDTGASGWHTASLPFMGIEWGREQICLTHHGDTLVTAGQHSVYVMDLTTGVWSVGALFYPDAGGIIHDGTRFIIGHHGWGTDLTFLTSETGFDWEDTGFQPPDMPPEAGSQWSGDDWDWLHRFPLCHSGSRYVAVAGTGFIVSSTDGLNWQTVRYPRAHEHALRGVATKDGVFVAVGGRGTILRSTDGLRWNRCEVPVAEDLFAVAAGETWFMAVGRNKTVLISHDGEIWTQIGGGGDDGRADDDVAVYRAIGFGDGRFLILTNDGHSLLSGSEPLPVEITVSPRGSGTVLGSGRTVLAMTEGQALHATAVAMPGYEFTGWTGSIVQSGAELVTTVSAPLSLTANFVMVSSLNVQFREGPPLQEPRMAHRAAVFNGQPFLVGGHTTGYTRSGAMDRGDLEADTNSLLDFTLLDIPVTADGAAVAELADGSILIAGGAQGDLGAAPGVATAMILTPDDVHGASAAEVAAVMEHPRMNAAAARLDGGQVLIAGGWRDWPSPRNCELFTPADGGADAQFTEAGQLELPRSFPLILPTRDGGAVVAGGLRQDQHHALAVERYDPVANEFATVSESLLDNGVPWVLNTRLPGDVNMHRLADGRYLLFGWHRDSHEGSLFFFDPETAAFQRRAIYPPLYGVGDRTFPPVLDSGGRLAYLLTASHVETGTETTLHLHQVEIATGKRSTTTVPIIIPEYFAIGATVTALEAEGRTHLLLAGGSSATGELSDFHPVARTFLFTPIHEEQPEKPMTIARDYRGFAEDAGNTRMVRTADGTLHVTYTRATVAADSRGYYSAPLTYPYRSGGNAGWFSYTRSRDAEGAWQPAVRTEDFPEANHASSIAVDRNQRLHQGFTFNYGAYHTQSADGSSWSEPVALHDGGWGDWDFEPRLARGGAMLFAVFRACHGWDDYPANLLLRQWNLATGWSRAIALTEYPNDDEYGAGAEHARFQTRPDGHGVVLYTERFDNGVPRVLLLEVKLPRGDTSPPLEVSAPGRWADAGDVAVDDRGVAHIVWREADDEDAPRELWYRTFHAESGLGDAIRVTDPGEGSVRTATIGVYPGNRVLMAYGLHGDEPDSEYGGVYARKFFHTLSPPVRISRTDRAHSPGLRSTWDKSDPNAIDLTWVEVFSWGSELLHQEFPWSHFGELETIDATVVSNVHDATFTISGPVSGTFTMVGGEFTLLNLPAGLYTIAWEPVAGQAEPPPRTFTVTAEEDMSLGASYIDTQLHRVSFTSSPMGTGTVVADPPGIELLGGDLAFAGGEVTFRANPALGWVPVRWQMTSSAGDDEATGHTVTLTIDRDVGILVEFEPGGPFLVDTMLLGEGTIGPGGVVPAGGRFECMIAPAEGHRLQAVLVDNEVWALDHAVVVDPVRGDHSITAFTEPIGTEVSAVWLPEEGGYVTVPGNIAPNQAIEVQAHAADGYRFVEWRGDATGTAPAIQLLVDGDKSLTAVFAPAGARGDLNDDGAVSIEDAILARRMFAGEIPLDLERADMNDSGAIETSDIAAILDAAARCQRRVFSAQPVAPSSDQRLVEFLEGVRLTLPGDWPPEATTATVSILAVSDALPGLPPHLEAVTPVYDIRLAGIGDFGREIGLEIPLDAVDDDLFVLYLDPETNAWVPRPTETGAGRRSGSLRASGSISGKYVVVKVSGASYRVEGTHCVVYGDPSVEHKIGGAVVGYEPFGQQVAHWFDAAYAGYRDAGFEVPNYQWTAVNLFVGEVILDRRATLYLSTASHNYREAEYSFKTKKYYLPVSYRDAGEIRFTLAHELFHAIQNRRFSFPGMAANRWLMEMTAEYASCKGPWNEPLSLSPYGLDLSVGLGTVDDNHEYVSAHFLGYLLRQTGGTFHDLWTHRLAPRYTPHEALKAHVLEQTGSYLSAHYNEYLNTALFDTAVAAPARSEDLDLHIYGIAWGPEPGYEIDTTFTVAHSHSAGWLKTRLPPVTRAPFRVLVEFPDPEPIPSQMNVRIYNAPFRDDQRRTDGGRPPLASFFTGASLPFVSTILDTDRSVYVVAYNFYGSSAKNVRVRVRPLTLTMTRTPPVAEAYTPFTLKAAVSPIPDSVEELSAWWQTSDHSGHLIEEQLPRDTSEFEFTHAFQTEHPETFQVTFSLYGHDAEGRQRLIVRQTHDVPVQPRAEILLSPSVARADIGQPVAFAAHVRNGPPDPRFRWRFSSGMPPSTTSDPHAEHAYPAEGNYAVSVELTDAAAPEVVLAVGRANAMIYEPVQVIEPPADPEPGDPDAPMLDYSVLRRVDEVRWIDDVREVYFLDELDRRHGLYQSFLPDGRPLQIGMIIRDNWDGHWIGYWQDGTNRTHHMHLHLGAWHATTEGSRVRARGGYVHGYWSAANTFSVFMHGLCPPAIEPFIVEVPYPPATGRLTMLHCWGDTGELHFRHEVTFDNQGRYHGDAKGYDALGRLLVEGRFEHGVKVGVWKYFDYDSGISPPGVSYNHDNDPPNHE